MTLSWRTVTPLWAQERNHHEDSGSEQPFRKDRAKILFLNQFFWPDGAPTGILLEDVARALAKEGHEVTVVCGGRSVYGSGGEYVNPPPVRIVRTPPLPMSKNPFWRMVIWLSFLFWAGLRSFLLPRHDLTVVLTTPPGLSVIGILLKRLRGARCWIWEMDVYPDVATAVGAARKESFASRQVGAVLDWARVRADGVIALGDCMRDRLLCHGLLPEAVHIAQNWADGDLIQPVELPPIPPLTVMYSGNLGLAHEVETICQVMLRIRKNTACRFVFVGDGVRREEVRRFCQHHELKNALFLPYFERNFLVDSLGSCHLGLVTLRPECVGAVVPSKTYAFLAAGRPLLFIGPRGATTARVADQGCGWQHEAGDVDGVVARLEELLANPVLIEEAARTARGVFESHHSRSRGVERITRLLTGGDE